ncbi:MAG: hypothetical protein ACYC35_22455 [Pirellulales bacterium]
MLCAILAAFEGPLTRTHCVADASNHLLEFYRRVLRPMHHRCMGTQLQWTWSANYFQAAERITRLAETIFGVGRDGSAWAAKVRKVLKEKSNGVSRVLHSMGALRSRRVL